MRAFLSLGIGKSTVNISEVRGESRNEVAMSNEKRCRNVLLSFPTFCKIGYYVARLLRCSTLDPGNMDI
jgi:hypothetical protein